MVQAKSFAQKWRKHRPEEYRQLMASRNDFVEDQATGTGLGMKASQVRTQRRARRTRAPKQGHSLSSKKENAKNRDVVATPWTCVCGSTYSGDRKRCGYATCLKWRGGVRDLPRAKIAASSSARRKRAAPKKHREKAKRVDFTHHERHNDYLAWECRGRTAFLHFVQEMDAVLT